MFSTIPKQTELRLTVSNIVRHPKMQMVATKPEVLTHQRGNEVSEKFQRPKLFPTIPKPAELLLTASNVDRHSKMQIRRQTGST